MGHRLNPKKAQEASEEIARANLQQSKDATEVAQIERAATRSQQAFLDPLLSRVYGFGRERTKLGRRTTT